MSFPQPLLSHYLAAALFGLLVAWQLWRGPRSSGQRTLIAAFALTSIWAWLEAIRPGSLLTGLAEVLRNLVWIGLLHSLATHGDPDHRQKGLKLVYASVAAVLGMLLIVRAIGPLAPEGTDFATIGVTLNILHILAAAGGLVLVHNFYGQAEPGSRSSLRLAMLALAWIWLYDLNFYTVTYLSAVHGDLVGQWRGLAVAIAAPLFAFGARSDRGWRFRMSRAATFQSLSLLGICAYFAVMAVLATVLRAQGGDVVGAVAVTLLTILVVGAMVILPSSRARAWAKVKIAKHFFEHRYDYRTEWLRFTATVGGDEGERGPLGARIVRAFADMLDAPGGVLLVRDDHDGLRAGGVFNWGARLVDPPAAVFADEQEARFWEHVVEEGRILELNGLRGGWGDPRDRAAGPPRWLLEREEAAVAIPLLAGRQLVGLVLLGQPEFPRPLDWEDFDLLRTAGRQAASALAEKISQEALAKAQRFEEFNRRFAFIMHDIKNLVSQLSLLSRNAERHADNPEFRADMVATLKSSVEKMNDLLARLAPQGARTDRSARATRLDEVLSFAVAAKRADHDVRLFGNRERFAIADAAGLEQAIGHLVQNAIDASPSDKPVFVRVDGDAQEVVIEIVDEGHGMDPEFVRSRLFEPFASTKDNGFGIGAYEARELVLAMGGRLDVQSQPGAGTRFTIRLPAAPPVAERKSA
ncbi:XrtA/PEP-CTERM system histidine kinase PrsK [Sphingomicrobium astaxanthinifaciens]|uniref:XrtA/PEP-CTERM system histidine kinase PrsK n=1 Tax=Sphingomicrobium astaxanthinifaciens TaxID=1227949 RepID=UPI001FCC53D1|nr:XrtA/PEP-CTERM system histidine kinase PrsK [Sphingomicrobium astaxanthinifaciens]MCJ7420729.1 PEP-CTERM system histidine kinase PrsK [Sphingomicrobium astaxanthinifaciens]